ncbi:hypothetical protein Tco_0012430 [Tanacetum coccineum]
MEINHDVKRNEVEVLVKEMLQGEKGKEMRRNAKERKRKAKEAIEVGGSSYKKPYFQEMFLMIKIMPTSFGTKEELAAMQTTEVGQPPQFRDLPGAAESESGSGANVDGKRWANFSCSIGLSS